LFTKFVSGTEVLADAFAFDEDEEVVADLALPFGGCPFVTILLLLCNGNEEEDEPK
jgi:hypothetical protein